MAYLETVIHCKVIIEQLTILFYIWMSVNVIGAVIFVHADSISLRVNYESMLMDYLQAESSHNSLHAVKNTVYQVQNFLITVC